MPAITLTTAEQAGIAAADSTLDTAFSAGMVNPDTSQNTPLLQGYNQSASIGAPPIDARPLARYVFRDAWVALVRALSSFVEGETQVTLFSGTWTGSNVFYYKDPYGRVFLRGSLSSGSISTAAFTLPVGYHPSNTRKFAVTSNGAFGEVQVDVNGNVTPSQGSASNVSLDGISFLA